MQLPTINSALKPITIAAGMLTATPIFMYGDIDNIHNIVSSERTSQYLEVSDNADNFLFSRRFMFDLHLQRWKENTMFQSSASSIVSDPDFQAIVSMGQFAVPFIKEEIANEPSTLVWALNLIYGKRISNNPNLTIKEACKLWIKAI